MALTRAMLKGMGLTDEQIGAIIDEHTSVTTSLKDQIKEYKEAFEKLPGVEKELADLKKDVEDNDWKGKYEKEHKDYEDYKTDVANKELSAKVKSAYSKLLTECKVGEKQIDAILKVTDFSGMKLAEDGTLEGADKLKENIGSTWSGFITTKETHGADVNNPPAGDKGGNGGSSRAAELAAKYHDNLYGKVKEG